MTTLRSRLPVLAVAAVAAAGLSACSGGASDGYGAPAAPAPADPAASTPAVGTILSANSTAQLGTVVVDGQGYTLYRYDKDSPKPPASTCADDCAQKWPPVLATPGSPLTVEGVAQEAVGTVNRPDGSIQLTLGGWPVYRFAGDTKPGATTGQGVGGTWAAVTPDGKKAGANG
jgi:predicted lipoprotein with Yx(FWY)xxD motif